jgi:hypothetical protein
MVTNASSVKTALKALCEFFEKEQHPAMRYLEFGLNYQAKWGPNL